MNTLVRLVVAEDARDGQLEFEDQPDHSRHFNEHGKEQQGGHLHHNSPTTRWLEVTNQKVSQPAGYQAEAILQLGDAHISAWLGHANYRLKFTRKP